MNYKPNTPYSKAISWFVSKTNLGCQNSLRILTEFIHAKEKNDLLAARFLIKMYYEDFYCLSSQEALSE